MDKESAKAAQLKAKSILPKVGYPTSPNTTDPASLERWYAGTKVIKEDFFGSVLSSILTTNAKEWLMLGRTRDRGSWEMYPQTVNAYYCKSRPHTCLIVLVTRFGRHDTTCEKLAADYQPRLTERSSSRLASFSLRSTRTTGLPT